LDVYYGEQKTYLDKKGKWPTIEDIRLGQIRVVRAGIMGTETNSQKKTEERGGSEFSSPSAIIRTNIPWSHGKGMS